MALTSNQIRHLKNMAHSLKPVIQIGQNGVSESVSRELDNALTHHELLKVKLASDNREDRLSMIEQLIELSQAEKIQYIGKIVTLFRRNPKQPKIELPNK
jgi:RNA-binding protein